MDLTTQYCVHDNGFDCIVYSTYCQFNHIVMHTILILLLLFLDQNQIGKKKYSGRLLISASATVGALLLVALMCFWGCFLYKKFGKNDRISLAMDVGSGLLYLSVACIQTYLSYLFSTLH